MKQFVAHCSTPDAMAPCLREARSHCEQTHPKGVIAHIYCSLAHIDEIDPILKCVDSEFPDLPLIGVLTDAPIMHGKFLKDAIVITVTAFDTTSVKTIACDCTGDKEIACAKQVSAWIDAHDDVRGFELMMTVCDDMHFARFLRPLDTCRADIPIFGMASAIYNDNRTCVFTHDGIVKVGAAGVLFFGGELHFNAGYAFGWRPLGKTFTATRVEENILMELDYEPALEIYERYLKFGNDQYFSVNSVEFPLISNEKGRFVGRAAVGCRQDGALVLIADVPKGSKLRLGYGDPELLEQADVERDNELIAFSPEAVLVYVCLARATFLEGNAKHEIEDIEKIAASCGCLCWGEIMRIDGKVRIINASTVTVGMREGPYVASAVESFAYKPMKTAGRLSLVERLARFIQETTSELNAANEELLETTHKLEDINKQLKHLAITDSLTGAYNRRAFEDVLNTCISSNTRPLSLIMIDLDNFKMVNDCFGHDAGDRVLITTTELIRKRLQDEDSIGRWGGDEFMVIAHMSHDAALKLANQLVEDVCNYDFGTFKITISVGVVSARSTGSLLSLYRRADHALYDAKRKGRNRVAHIA